MRFLASAVGAIAALALLIGATGGSSVEAAQIRFEGFASGAEENPPVPGSLGARVRFIFDDATNDLSYAVTVSGPSADQVTAAHIHRGARGVNGPVVHPLSTVGFTQVAGSIRLSAADVTDLMAGNFYFNVHSKDNPGGFARFQLVPPARPAGGPGIPGPGALVRPAGPGGPGGPMGPGPGPGPRVTPPSTGDAGLADDSTWLPLAGLAVIAVSGLGVLNLATKRA